MYTSCTLPALDTQPTHGCPIDHPSLLCLCSSPTKTLKLLEWRSLFGSSLPSIQQGDSWPLSWAHCYQYWQALHSDSLKGDKLEHPPFASCGEWWATAPRASFRSLLLWRSTACYLWIHSYWHSELHPNHFMLRLNTANNVSQDACSQVLRYTNWHNFIGTDSFPVSIHWSTSQYH